MPACRDCGSTDIQFDDAPDGDWWDTLITISDRVPGRDHCTAWLDSKGIADEVAEQVATSMLASLRYDSKKGVWKRGSTEYVQIWATFRSWCLRDLRQNGARPGTSMKVKEGYY